MKQLFLYSNIPSLYNNFSSFPITSQWITVYAALCINSLCQRAYAGVRFAKQHPKMERKKNPD